MKNRNKAIISAPLLALLMIVLAFYSSAKEESKALVTLKPDEIVDITTEAGNFSAVSENTTERAISIISKAVENRYWTMHTVGEERYNCADFTEDSVLALREANYTAYPMCGYLNHVTYHAWVGVEVDGALLQIEPQNMNFITDHTDNYTNARRCVVRGVA